MRAVSCVPHAFSVPASKGRGGVLAVLTRLGASVLLQQAAFLIEGTGSILALEAFLSSILSRTAKELQTFRPALTVCTLCCRL